MSADQDPQILEHEYDGIQEFDNPMPGWWKIMFIGTCLWAVWYVVWYHGPGPGESELEEYRSARADYEAWMAEITPDITEELLAQRAADPAAVERGQQKFQSLCVACHDHNGGGREGPNLTDDHQLHGTARMDLYTTIRDGVPGKPMVPWGPQLGLDIIDVTAYVASLRGTHVDGGKAPEGPEVPAYP